MEPLTHAILMAKQQAIQSTTQRECIDFGITHSIESERAPHATKKAALTERGFYLEVIAAAQSALIPLPHHFAIRP